MSAPPLPSIMKPTGRGPCKRMDVNPDSCDTKRMDASCGINPKSRLIKKAGKAGKTTRKILDNLKHVNAGLKRLSKQVNALSAPGDTTRTELVETQTDPMSVFNRCNLRDLMLPSQRENEELKTRNQALERQTADLRMRIKALTEANRALTEGNRALKQQCNDLARSNMKNYDEYKRGLDTVFEYGTLRYPKYTPGDAVLVIIDGIKVAFGYVVFATDLDNAKMIVDIVPELNQRVTVEGDLRTVDKDDVMHARRYKKRLPGDAKNMQQLSE